MLRDYSKSAGAGKQSHPHRGPGIGIPVSASYADALLTTLGLAPCPDSPLADRHPALAWAASGTMALTGRADGPPVIAPGHLAACADGTMRAFAALCDDDTAPAIDGAALLGERAAILGLTRRGTTSSGGSCRLLRTSDGWIAVSLPRPDDHASLPAWLGIDATDRPWDAIADTVATRRAAPIVARARLLGIAAAEAARPAPAPPPWYRVVARGSRAQGFPVAPPLVLDLSALWAGPLAAHLLHLTGARVIKVESIRRPDGARQGVAAFFDLLNAGKQSVALDLATAAGRAALARLIARADIVIESARPRALAQLGFDTAALVAARPGLTWISITGYGRSGHGANWIAFGDDAAAASGLAAATGALAGSDTPLFCGDAIADPLTGMHAAVAALAAYRHGGGALLSVALRDIVAHVFAFGPPSSPATVRLVSTANGARAWEAVADGERQTIQSPRARRPAGVARPLGADTDGVLRENHG